MTSLGDKLTAPVQKSKQPISLQTLVRPISCRTVQGVKVRAVSVVVAGNFADCDALNFADVNEP